MKWKKIFKDSQKVKGFLDGVEDSYAYGWAWNPANPEERLEIVIYADGKPIAEGVADEFREDLLKAGIGDGKYGFKIKLPESLADGKEHIFKAEAKAYSTFLINEFKVKISLPKDFGLPNLDNLDTDLTPRGCVEKFENGVFYGWCLLPEDPFEIQTIEVYLDDLLIGKVITEKYRKDISEVIGFPVKAGFEFKIDEVDTRLISEIIKRLNDASNIKDIFIFKIAGTDFYLKSYVDYEKAIPEIIKILRNRLSKLAYRGRYIEFIEKTIREEPFIKEIEETENVKIIAFYLPQYHPFAENNDWWGPGFTEWTHVATAKPYFTGHYQPRIPADLGYYDLRLEEVHLKQIELAKRYGLYGFCYHYYWFSSKKLMNLAVERHFNNDYDFNFCICWANENWSRRWDGSDQEVLISQDEAEGDALAFIEEVSKYFHSPKYIKIDGAPFIIVYNLKKLPNPRRIIKLWKDSVKSLGFPDLHVCMAETFGQDNSEQICDSACQFPPHKVVSRLINSELPDLPEDYTGNIYDYEEVVINEIRQPDPSYILFRTVMGAWDNTPRRKKSGNVFHNFSPELFEAWLSFAVYKTKRTLPPSMRFVFINAWNEWGEGTYLEPDRKYGHRLLRAVKNSLSMVNEHLIESMVKAYTSESPDIKLLFNYITTLKNSTDTLLKMATDFYERKSEYYLSKFIPFERNIDYGLKLITHYKVKVLYNIDSINGRRYSIKNHVLDNLGYLHLKGWQLIEGIPILENMPTYVGLIDKKDDTLKYIAQIYIREKRNDVAQTFNAPTDYYYGFSFIGELKRVKPGSYNLSLLMPFNANEYLVVKTDYTFIIG